jgi:hypothetical protein
MIPSWLCPRRSRTHTLKSIHKPVESKPPELNNRRLPNLVEHKVCHPNVHSDFEGVDIHSASGFPHDSFQRLTVRIIFHPICERAGQANG